MDFLSSYTVISRRFTFDHCLQAISFLSMLHQDLCTESIDRVCAFAYVPGISTLFIFPPMPVVAYFRIELKWMPPAWMDRTYCSIPEVTFLSLFYP